ncbi:MAG: deoxyribodipyrimidine photo-lyase [Coriobacteriia bacterium]|nr:deoxyribodipyrimidine photo-lyase [Coriobacteriia bacterium]
MPSIVLFTNDLRLADNPALVAAVAESPVVPLAVLDDEAHGDWRPGPAARAWRAASLAALARGLEARGGWLVVRTGATSEEVLAVARETGARTVHLAGAIEPERAAWQQRLAKALAAEGMRVVQHPPNLLHEPGTLTTTDGRPYLVFTAFLRAFERRVALEAPLPAPSRIPVPPRRPASEPLPEPAPDAPPLMLETFTPGEDGARTRANAFFADAVAEYGDRRDLPAIDGTSRLSPHLAFGEVSARELYWRALRATEADPAFAAGALSFARQLVWREFAYHLLASHPATPTTPLRPEFARFPWSYDAAAFDAWRAGQTGFPLVDAGMRELAATGWMHNRVRMVVASFLTKDLLVPWQDGARWFWERLADADLADNTLGWQWVAGCGADAQPFFRIFNPAGQSRRFDAAAYVRRWVPELARVPDRWIHAPWEAPEPELAAAGVRLGETYPHPIVDHAAARARALDAYRALRAGGR